MACPRSHSEVEESLEQFVFGMPKGSNWLGKSQFMPVVQA